MPYNHDSMATPQISAQGKRPTRRQRLRSFWESVTEGFRLNELWSQFKSEAQAGYGLYSRDVDWDAINQHRSRFTRMRLSAWALFRAMLMKLSPARRVLLLVAVVLLLFNPDFRFGNGQIDLGFAWLGTLILFVLLALELGDRVTMKRDLEIAREIQQWLVPNEPPQVLGIDIAFATRPQNTVAGDYYDAFLRPVLDAGARKPSLLVVVADVAGKSVPAALLMATFQSGLRTLASTPASLDEIVTGLDRYARAHSLEGRRFTTAFLAEIDPETRAMRYVNAGHNDPILRRATGQTERLSSGGPPFGLPLFTVAEINYASATVQLQPGDLLFIFTDGVAEAVNEKGEEFGESRIMATILTMPSGSANAILNRVMADVNAFVGYARQHDDITALVLRVIA
ncbi:MAG: PP2C family protein-serine/threonine phosphatase [Candidatus Acidiferrales bacterium]